MDVASSPDARAHVTIAMGTMDEFKWPTAEDFEDLIEHPKRRKPLKALHEALELIEPEPIVHVKPKLKVADEPELIAELRKALLTSMRPGVPPETQVRLLRTAVRRALHDLTDARVHPEQGRQP